jgi:hypothetical protein
VTSQTSAVVDTSSVSVIASTRNPTTMPTVHPVNNNSNSTNASAASLGIILGCSIGGIVFIGIICFSMKQYQQKQAAAGNMNDDHLEGGDRDVDMDGYASGSRTNVPLPSNFFSATVATTTPANNNNNNNNYSSSSVVAGGSSDYVRASEVEMIKAQTVDLNDADSNSNVVFATAVIISDVPFGAAAGDDDPNVRYNEKGTKVCVL